MDGGIVVVTADEPDDLVALAEKWDNYHVRVVSDDSHSGSLDSLEALSVAKECMKTVRSQSDGFEQQLLDAGSIIGKIEREIREERAEQEMNHG